MQYFDRYWKLTIKGTTEPFFITIKPDEFGNSLRVKFDITATTDLKYYTGSIKIYNLGESKRKQLLFNQLLEAIGTGPKVNLTAGYKQQNGLIFSGAVHRGLSTFDPPTGNWLTVLQVGVPMNMLKDVTIPPAQVTNLNLVSFLKGAIDKVLDQSGVDIKKGLLYDANITAAITEYLSNTGIINESIGYSNPAEKVLDEISTRFNIIFYYDHTGFNAISGKYTSSSDSKFPLTQPAGQIVPTSIFSKDTGLIGAPIYTDTGAKLINYLRANIKIFEFIRVKSKVLDKNISVLELNHHGDTHTNEWYSEVDGSNLNQAIVNNTNEQAVAGVAV